jgi:hypothetical protein
MLAQLTIAILLFGVVSVMAEQNETWGYWVQPKPDQKGGTVTPNFFPYIEPTNHTDRKLLVKVKTDIPEETIKEIHDKFKLTYTVQMKSSGTFDFEKVAPITELIENNAILIPLTDGLLDSYKVCIWFGEYENDKVCEGFATAKNIISKELDLTLVLKYVHADLVEESTVDEDREEA